MLTQTQVTLGWELKAQGFVVHIINQFVTIQDPYIMLNSQGLLMNETSLWSREGQMKLVQINVLPLKHRVHRQQLQKNKGCN